MHTIVLKMTLETAGRQNYFRKCPLSHQSLCRPQEGTCVQPGWKVTTPLLMGYGS